MGPLKPTYFGEERNMNAMKVVGNDSDCKSTVIFEKLFGNSTTPQIGELINSSIEKRKRWSQNSYRQIPVVADLHIYRGSASVPFKTRP